MLTALRAARKHAKLTLKDVADALGRPISFVSKCETGERRIDPIDLWQFASLYGRPVAAFLPPHPAVPTVSVASRRTRAPRTEA